MNEVVHVNFQTGNKIEKRKFSFAEVSSGFFFRQFLVRVFELRKCSEEIRKKLGSIFFYGYEFVIVDLLRSWRL